MTPFIPTRRPAVLESVAGRHLDSRDLGALRGEIGVRGDRFGGGGIIVGGCRPRAGGGREQGEEKGTAHGKPRSAGCRRSIVLARSCHAAAAVALRCWRKRWSSGPVEPLGCSKNGRA